jgi:hypothetical protein
MTPEREAKLRAGATLVVAFALPQARPRIAVSVTRSVLSSLGQAYLKLAMQAYDSMRCQDIDEDILMPDVLPDDIDELAVDEIVDLEDVVWEELED